MTDEEENQYRKVSDDEIHRGAYLTYADLTEADLIRADLIRADLTEANFTGADLIRADLTEANFTGADLIRADLIRADLIRADLTEANFTGADLIRADLIRADLTGVDLTGADLTGAKLYGVKTEDAFFLTQEQLNSALGDSETTIPENLKRPDHWLKHPFGKPPTGKEITRQLAATSPIGFTLGNDGKIHFEDTPLNTPPPEDNPLELDDLIQALTSEIDDLKQDLDADQHPRNFDQGYIVQQLERYEKALAQEKLSWHRLDSKSSLIMAMMLREDAEGTWDENIVAALRGFLALHAKLEPLIRPKQPEIPLQPPEINSDKVKSEGVSNELQQKVHEFSTSADFQEITGPDTQALFIEQAEELAEQRHNPKGLITAAQKFSALTEYLDKETAKLNRVMKNIRGIMISLAAIMVLFAIFF